MTPEERGVLAAERDRLDAEIVATLNHIRSYGEHLRIVSVRLSKLSRWTADTVQSVQGLPPAEVVLSAFQRLAELEKAHSDVLGQLDPMRRAQMDRYW